MENLELMPVLWNQPATSWVGLVVLLMLQILVFLLTATEETAALHPVLVINNVMLREMLAVRIIGIIAMPLVMAMEEKEGA
jgi:hypothetical protein